MKLLKRLPALALVLALAIGLALPAFAQEEPDPALPVITVQPQNVRPGLGQDITLKVEAHIPNGTDQVGYRWYRVVGKRPIPMEQEGKTAALTIMYLGTGYFYVEVYNRSNPSYSVKSETVSVKPFMQWYLWPLAIIIAPFSLFMHAFTFLLTRM